MKCNDGGGHTLVTKQCLGRMVHVVVREGGHEVVRVVVVGLVADCEVVLAETEAGGDALQVFGEQLALLVEVVSGSLEFLLEHVSCNSSRVPGNIPRQSEF